MIFPHQSIGLNSLRPSRLALVQRDDEDLKALCNLEFQIAVLI